LCISLLRARGSKHALPRLPDKINFITQLHLSLIFIYLITELVGEETNVSN
jgi:hypothetical protein